MSDAPNEQPLCSASIRRGGVVEAWSAALEELTGWPAEHAAGRPLREFLVPLEPVVLPSFDAPAACDWDGCVALIVRNQTVPIVCRATLSSSSDGQPVRLEIDATSALSSAATRIDRSDAPQRFEALTDALPGFFYTVDTELVFTSSVGAGLSALRLEPEQLVGTKLTELWGTRDLAYEPMRCHLRALAGVPQRYRDVCVGRAIDYQLRPLVGSSGKVVGVIGVGLDVTDEERRRAEQAKLVEQLRVARQQALGSPIEGGIVHELNNLLTAVMGNVALAQQKLGERSDVSAHLEDAIRGAEAASQLVREASAHERVSAVGFSRPPLARTTPPPETGRRENILLVDDEPMLLEMASGALEQLGYDVIACASAEDALRVFESSPKSFDLLVTDVVMPRMNGKELVARVRALHPRVAVLYTSGYGESVVSSRGATPKDVHFVDKPYRLAQLASKVREILDGREVSSTRAHAVGGGVAVGT